VSDVVTLTLAASVTILATGLGALPVIALGAQRTARVHALLTGFAAGAMGVASVVGLIVPGIDDGGFAAVAAGAAVGVGFLAFVRRRLGPEARQGGDRGWLLVAIVLFAHSLPEGLAVGTAYGSETAGLGLFIVLAIALQNVPEGTATAIPMQEAGFRPAAQIGAALATSAPQLPGALAAYALVETVEPLLPFSFGFAAGAMLALTIQDLAPDALRLGHRVQGVAGAAFGGVTMGALARIAGI
jgi:zinc transporter, ZIP family